VNEMANAKKQALTAEELLAQALVPADEQPYDVPDNWVWTRYENAVSPSDAKMETFSSDVKYIGLEHIEKDGGILGHGDASELKSLKNVFSVGDILYGKLRPYLNKHDIATFDGVCSTDILVFKPAENCDARLANYFLDLSNFIEYVVSNSKGINLPRVSKEVVLAAAFPLPPLPEQHRIVARIESLFEKLNRAKALVQSALDSFETRRAAILHKAFTGELTAKWREDNGVGLDSWDSQPLLNLVVGFKYGSNEKSDYSNNGIPVIRIPNISDGYIDFDDMKYLVGNNVSVDDQIANGDILIIRSNGSRDLVGKCALVEELDKPHAYASYLIRIRPKGELIPRYLLGLFQSTVIKSQLFAKAKSSAGINNINSKELGQLQIPVPLPNEQQEIVRILDELLDKEQAGRSCQALSKKSTT